MMSQLPDPLKRRSILYGRDTPAAVLEEFGYVYLKEGRPNDAVEFFGRARCREGLARVRETARGEGDFFLFSRAVEFMGDEVPSQEWHKLGSNALRKARYRFALSAFEKIGDSEGIAEAKRRLKDLYEA